MESLKISSRRLLDRNERTAEARAENVPKRDERRRRVSIWNLAFGKWMANVRSKELDATGRRESDNGGALKNRKRRGAAFRID